MSDGMAARGFSWLNNPQNPLQRGAANINNWLDTSQGVTAGLGRSFMDIGRGVTASRQAGGWSTPQGRQLAAQAAKQASPWVAGGVGAKLGAAALGATAPKAGLLSRFVAGGVGAGVAERGAELATGTSMVAPPRVSSTERQPGEVRLSDLGPMTSPQGRQPGEVRLSDLDRMQAGEQQAQQRPEYATPDWITAMSGLSPTESWELEERADQADRSFKRLEEQAAFERERGQVATTARLRGASQAGAGAGVDLQSALARRGLGTSMAASGVGSEFITNRTAQERAAAQGAFGELEARLTRDTSLAKAEKKSFLASLRRQEQAMRQENQDLADALAKQHREWWMSQYG